MSLEKAQAVLAGHRAGEASIPELCRQQGITTSMYYYYRDRLTPKSKKVKTIKKRKYTRRASPQVVDIPLAAAPTKYYIVVCESAEAVRNLVG